MTYTPNFDGVTGVNLVSIDTSDAFYAAGHDYTVVLTGAAIDGETVNTVLAAFSIEHRYPTPEQTADGLLDRTDGIESNKTLRKPCASWPPCWPEKSAAQAAETRASPDSTARPCGSKSPPIPPEIGPT